ncbi:MAG: sialate O-acetylesterase [Clostridia bacterium]|nr:sialate O-acetylesterase [Clostridia bacterium]
MKRYICIIFFLLTLTLPTLCADAQTWTSTADFSYHEVGGSDCFIEQEAEFDVTPLKADVNGYIGYSSAQNTIDAWNDCAVVIRMTGGYFDVRSGGEFYKENLVAVEAGKAHHVICKMDFKRKKFSVKVDGVYIAQDAAFRSDAAEMKSAGKLVVRGGLGEAAGEFSVSNHAMLSLPNLFAENMVIARDKPFCVWGTAKPHETVEIEFAGKISETVADENGDFSAKLQTPEARLTPYTLTVLAGDAYCEISRVYVGDVYVLAGQSNMAQSYNHQTTEQLGGGVTVDNIPSRIVDSRIKHFTLRQIDSADETYNVPFLSDSWQSLDADNNKELSYIGQFFASELLTDEPNVPIGLMSVAWRGTTINRWMRLSDENKTPNFTPSNGKIYNNHIHPLLNYNVTGILWYQGESDANYPIMYSEAFARLIDDYREQWGAEDLPFIFVQLARYSKENYAPLREAQRIAAANVKNTEKTAMVTILDTDSATYENIHPLGKEKVAAYIASAAREIIYGREENATAPRFLRAEADANTMTLYFENIGKGLKIKNTYAISDSLCEFEVAGKTGDYVPAEARINADGTITVSSLSVAEPKYVRYAYSAVPENPNLFGENGLPVSPFISDDRIFSAASFSTRATGNLAPVSVIDFDICMTEDNVDAVVAHTAAENGVSAWNSCGIVLRAYTSGLFEYRDGSEFKASAVPYEKNVVYHVQIAADTVSKTFSAFVTPEGGQTEIICLNAAFRSDALEMQNCGRLLVRGGNGAPAGKFFVDNYTYRAVETAGVITFTKGQYAVYCAEDTLFCIDAVYDNDCLEAVRSDTKSVEARKVSLLEFTGKPLIWHSMETMTPRQ